MSKVVLNEMTRDELIELQGQVKLELKKHRPYRIKERVVQCGSASCWCHDGPDGHGPYLVATFRDGGKTRALSLGPKLDDRELRDSLPADPDPFDYLQIPDHKYMALPRSVTEGWMFLTLSPLQFRERYGVEMSQDVFDRPRKFWGSRDSWNDYEESQRLAWESQTLTYNPWRSYGVATLDAVAKLEALETRKYYLKD